MLDIADLLQKFLEIKKMGYVKSVGKSSFAIGDTFEKLLGKERDELPFADYNGIEIKTKGIYSNYDVSLFNAEADGKYLFANEDLVNEFGYLKKGKKLKFFYLEVTGKTKTKYINHYFQVEVDYEMECLVLKCYDADGNLVNDNTTWSFSLLKERLRTKITNLAVIRYYKKETNDNAFYWYYSVDLYIQINFEKFLKAIEDGNITICFSFDEFKSGPRIGQRHNHGTHFKIKPKALLDVYENHFYYN